MAASQTRTGTRTALEDFGRRADKWATAAERWLNAQRPRVRRAVAVAAVFVMAVLLNGVCGALSRTSTTSPAAVTSLAPRASAAPAAPSTLTNETAPSDAGRSWSVVRVLQGSGAGETAAFPVGQHWRIDWVFDPTSPAGQFSVLIYTADGRLLSLAASTQKAGPDTTFWAGSGTYVLKVISSGGDWKLDVQDLR